MAFIQDGKRIVDLRSDTVTQPTPEMREAMFKAEVGDDVLGDDPTVIRLEAMAAERTGKEAALFVASGTMGNLVALLTHCQRGHEMIVGDQSHTFVNEAGGAAALGGIHPHTVKNQPDGTLSVSDIEAAIREAGGWMLVDVRLFDVFRGEKIGASKKSLAYSLTFQAADRTLKDKDADKQREKIVRTLEAKFGAKLRE